MKYLRLIKFILSGAVGLSACIGYSLSNSSISDFRVLKCFAGVFLMAAGASVLNQYLEKKTDSLMERTKSRPIPAGEISPKYALIYSIILSLTGTTILLYLNIWAMVLGILNLIIYDFVYTPLKYKTSLCLIPGGLVGGIPPLIGWFVAGESSVSLSIIYLSGFMFLWQIPHFIILNLKYSSDYDRAGIISVASVIGISKVKLIALIWFISSAMLTFFFPLAGIISSKIRIYLLLILNASLIIIFILLLFNKASTLKITNLIIHLYIFLLFIIILSERMV